MREFLEWGLFGEASVDPEWRRTPRGGKERPYPSPADVLVPIGLLLLLVLSIALAADLLTVVPGP